MIADEMKKILANIADLCYQASEEIHEDEDTKEILDTCDKLQDLIDEYLKTDKIKGVFHPEKGEYYYGNQKQS